MTAPDDLPVYPIRTVAALSGVDARRLRSWEAQYDLLHPARTRGGHRLYSLCDLRRVREIRRLVEDEGMSLQGIRAWLAAPSTGTAGPGGGQADAGEPRGAPGAGRGAGTEPREMVLGGPQRANAAAREPGAGG